MNAPKSTILVIILLSLLLISACSKQPEEIIKAQNASALKITPSDSKPSKALYEIYTQKSDRFVRIDSIYIIKNNYVDNRSHELNGSVVKLVNQGIVNNFFSVNIEYRNKTGRLWMGAALRDGLIPLGNSVEISSWEVNRTLYIEFVMIEEIDFNITSHDWNYIKVTVAVYNETILIPVVPEPAIEIREISFETISKGSSSGHEERAAYLITNGSDWESLVRLSKIAIPEQPKIIFGEEMVMPQINFEEETVIAVFQGTFGSGHGIEVIRVVEKEDFLEVFVKESYESAGTPVETRPYHVVKTKKTDKKPIFPEGNFEIVNIGYGAPSHILRMGETKTFVIQTKDYEVTITEISGVPLKAKFTFNGQVFDLEKGEAYQAEGGIQVKVRHVTAEFVEFELLP